MSPTAATWSDPGIVAGFARSPPNPQLIAYARRRRCAWSATRVLDIGCGAGRNAVPLAGDGFDVIGLDVSRPMLTAATARAAGGRLRVVEAAMHDLPVRSRSIDLIVAHGIWNLARSDAEFHAAIGEAARIAAEDAAAFVFTFSRHTLPASAVPVDGESFTFTDFSGEPQIFLTLDQLLTEMYAVGFEADPAFTFRELNLPPAACRADAGRRRGQIRIGGAPVIFEAAFRFRGK